MSKSAGWPKILNATGRPARVLSMTAAQTNFESMMRTVERSGVCVVSRRGKPVAVMVATWYVAWERVMIRSATTPHQRALVECPQALRSAFAAKRSKRVERALREMDREFQAMVAGMQTPAHRRAAEQLEFAPLSEILRFSRPVPDPQKPPQKRRAVDLPVFRANRKTEKAMKDALRGKGVKRVGTVKALFDEATVDGQQQISADKKRPLAAIMVERRRTRPKGA